MIAVGVFARVELFHLAARETFDDWLAVELDLAVRGLVDARDAVERGRFAGAVRADERDDLALVHLEVQVVDGDDAAELHGGVFHLQKRFLLTHLDASSFFAAFAARLARRARMRSGSSRSPMMPLRKNSTTIMMMTENTTMRKPLRRRNWMMHPQSWKMARKSWRVARANWQTRSVPQPIRLKMERFRRMSAHQN